MKKLNRKGYVTVEVLVAAVIAAAIAVFLIDLTVKLVNKTDDAYVDITLTTDKALIIDNIKSNISYDMNVNKYENMDYISCSTSNCIIDFLNSYDRSEERKIIIENNILKYCDGKNCFYTKKLDSSLSDIGIKSNINGKVENNAYVFFTITGKNIFSDEDYSITVPILNKYDPLYKVEIKRQFGTNSAITIKTFTVNKNGTSSTVNVSGTADYPTYDSVSCNNGQTSNISKTTSSGIDTVGINVSNVTNDTECTVKFRSSNYTVTIKRKLGTNSATIIQTLTVAENGNSSSVNVEGTTTYPTYNGITCTNGQNSSVIKSTINTLLDSCYQECRSSANQSDCADKCEEDYANSGIDRAKVTVNNVTNNTVCTVQFSS